MAALIWKQKIKTDMLSIFMIHVPHVIKKEIIFKNSAAYHFERKST